MSQIATTIEQSKRLLAAGLDPESADMKHTRLVIEADGEGYFSISHGEEFHIEVGNARFGDEFPAWSLSRLWDICNDSGIGPFNFGGDDIDSSSLIAKLVKWIIYGVLDYEVIDEYINAETIQEQNRHANH